MILKDFFVKDINRTIETVIKADDQDPVCTTVIIISRKKVTNLF